MIYDESIKEWNNKHGTPQQPAAFVQVHSKQLFTIKVELQTSDIVILFSDYNEENNINIITKTVL